MCCHSVFLAQYLVKMQNIWTPSITTTLFSRELLYFLLSSKFPHKSPDPLCVLTPSYSEHQDQRLWKEVFIPASEP